MLSAVARTLSDPVVRRLQMARFELEEGRGELSSSTTAGPYKAIKSFHDALETFVVALTDHAGIGRAHRTLSQWIGELQAATGKTFKHRYVVSSVGDLRDLAKHQAYPPNPEAVWDISGRLDAVFEDNAAQYLDVSFFGVRLADTVQHNHAKRELIAAEDAYGQGRFGEALGLLRAAFEMFLLDQHHGGKHTRSNRLVSDSLERQSLKLSPTLPHELRGINEQWKKLNERFRLVELGINLADYDRFEGITPNVFIPGDRTKRTIAGSGMEPLFNTKENAAFALMFVLNAIRRVEDQGRARNPRSFYRIRAKQRTPVSEYQGNKLTIVTHIEAAEEVADVHYGLGLHGPVWLWERDGKHQSIPFESCDIVAEVADAEHWRLKREAEWKERDKGSEGPIRPV
jgi:hypothetical protein